MRRGPLEPTVERQLRSPDAASRLADLLMLVPENLLAPSWNQIRNKTEEQVTEVIA